MTRLQGKTFDRMNNDCISLIVEQVAPEFVLYDSVNRSKVCEVMEDV